MSDSLLSYFEQELHFIRAEASRFAERHPGAARSLGISRNSIDDPQIINLIESVAFLNGRLQQHLDDSFPELAGSLIQLLFPHYLRPTPSYTLLDFIINNDANAIHHIPAGTEFSIQEEDNESLVFRSTESIALLPLRIKKVTSTYEPFDKPTGAEDARALIEISFQMVDETMDISAIPVESFKLYLKGGANYALRLYDLFALGTVQVAICANDQIHILGRHKVQPIAFDMEETVLPYQTASFGGFKLLSEFFMFPECFRGFRIELGDALKNITGHQFKLQVYVDGLTVDLARNLSEEQFSLFTVPLVNLYNTLSEPLNIDFLKKKYPIMLDATQQQGLELFSIEQVLDVTDVTPLEVPQIYSEKYVGASTGLRWQLLQRVRMDGVLESDIRVADLEHISAQSAPRTWVVNATATNGLMARRLLVTSQVECRESLTIPAQMQLLRRPSLAERNDNSDNNVWAMLGHLHFNYHAILGADDPTQMLKNIFSLYNRGQNAQNQGFIESLIGIDQEQIVAPIRISGKSCFAHGTKITVVLNIKHVNEGIALFGNMLDRFFSYFAGFNSFTQLDIRLQGKDHVYMTFPRRTGCKSLL